MTACGSRGVASLTPPLEQHLVGVEARGTARSCAGSPSCRRPRAAPGSRRARGRPGSGPGSWCRAPRGTGRRPCVRGPPGGVQAGLGDVARQGRGVRAPPRPPVGPGPVSSLRRPVMLALGPTAAIRVPRRPSGRGRGQDTPALPERPVSCPDPTSIAGHRCRPGCGTSCPARRSGAAWPGCAGPAAR